MPAAARIGDATTHGVLAPGPIASPRPVLIGGLPAARVGDLHVCTLVPPHPPGPVAQGSGSVFIGGQPALRTLDLCPCGATVAGGLPNVSIG